MIRRTRNNGVTYFGTGSERTSMVIANLVEGTEFVETDTGATYRLYKISWIKTSVDANAIHRNISNEISTVTEKVSPVGTDVILIEDSADSYNKKRVQITNLPTGASTFLSLTDTPSSYTAGSVLFTSSSAVTEDNANLFWDDTNDRLGIGTNSPGGKLTVVGSDFWQQVIIKANTVQAFNILEIEDSGGSILSGADARGILFSHGGTNTDNVFIGNNAGELTSTGVKNTAIGTNTLANVTSAVNNVAIGYNALFVLTSGHNNFAIGAYALTSLTTGTQNMALGTYALTDTSTGSNNVSVGYAALRESLGDNNVAIGSNAGRGSSNPDQCVFLGSSAGQTSTGTGNVFIGYFAGFGSALSNRLYIDNSSTSTPLVYGEFDNNLLRANGTFEIIGNSDAIQLTIKGHSTQTNNYLAIQDSSSSNLLVVDSSAHLVFSQASTISTLAGNLTLDPFTTIVVIDGAIRVGTTTDTTAGNIRWTGTDFEGYDGSAWQSLTGSGSSTDTNAIHDNVAGEIALITEKVSPVSADLIIIEDSADSNNKKRVQIGNLPGGSGSSTFLGLTDTPSSYTAGSILFTSATAVTEDNTNLFWDDTNNHLGIGTNSPSTELHILDGQMTISHSTSSPRIYLVDDVTGDDFSIQHNRANSRLDFASNGVVVRMSLLENGNFGIGTDLPSGKLHVVGTQDDQVAIIQGYSTQTNNILEVQNSASSLLFTVDNSGFGTFNSAIRIGTTSDTTAGNIRWTGTDFEGYDGASWNSFTGGGGGSSTFLSLTDTPSSYTNGSILFTSSSAVTEDNTNLFWDGTNNRLGIGTNSPLQPLHVLGTIYANPSQTATSGSQYGVYSKPNIAATSTSISGYFGIRSEPTITGGQSYTNQLTGMYSVPTYSGTNALTSIRGVMSYVVISGSGTVTNAYGFHGTITKSAGTITNAYGLYLTDVTVGGTLNYAIYTGSGTVRFGDKVTTEEHLEQANSYFSAYDSAGGTTIGTSWTNIPFDTQNRKDTLYTHSTSTNAHQITITEAGDYKITVDVMTHATSGTSRSYSRGRVVVTPSGGSLTEIGGTRMAMYNRDSNNGPEGNGSATFIYTASTNDVLTVQAQKVGTNTIQTMANGTRITIERI